MEAPAHAGDLSVWPASWPGRARAATTVVARAERGHGPRLMAGPARHLRPDGFRVAGMTEPAWRRSGGTSCHAKGRRSGHRTRSGRAGLRSRPAVEGGRFDPGKRNNLWQFHRDSGSGRRSSVVPLLSFIRPSRAERAFAVAAKTAVLSRMHQHALPSAARRASCDRTALIASSL